MLQPPALVAGAYTYAYPAAAFSAPHNFFFASSTPLSPQQPAPYLATPEASGFPHNGCGAGASVYLTAAPASGPPLCWASPYSPPPLQEPQLSYAVPARPPAFLHELTGGHYRGQMMTQAPPTPLPMQWVVQPRPYKENHAGLNGPFIIGPVAAPTSKAASVSVRRGDDATAQGNVPPHPHHPTSSVTSPAVAVARPLLHRSDDLVRVSPGDEWPVVQAHASEDAAIAAETPVRATRPATRRICSSATSTEPDHVIRRAPVCFGPQTPATLRGGSPHGGPGLLLRFSASRQKKGRPAEVPPPAPGDYDAGPRQLIVNYLSPDVDTTSLIGLFAPYGPIDVARIVTDPASGKSRGFAFLYFKTSAAARTAVDDASGRVLLGRRIRVSYAIPQRPVAEWGSE